ncbi:hypothetical protein E3E31_00040 [Thermococcus sp. M39]|uniref:hypothetical protein n=1 Tax=Thermococcus sp. M39 TaxID=1638262 RepID=UPI00143B3B8B|nr:hypothetical protein [Thermococcus sp. M39]NJE06946.1 hypothetical protein [Thermococcus sp. M39]
MITGEKEKLLKIIFESFYVEGDVIELRVFQVRHNKKTYARSTAEYFVFPRDFEKLIEVANRWEQRIRSGKTPWSGVYFGVHPRKAEVLQKQAEKKEKRGYYFARDEDVERFNVIYVDMDLFRDVSEDEAITLTIGDKEIILSRDWLLKHKEEAEAFKKKFAEKLVEKIEEDLGFAPFLVADSGFGLHLYFKLSQPVSDHSTYVSYFNIIREYLVDLFAELLGDRGLAEEIIDSKVYNAQRVSRLPFSVNSKKAFVFTKEGVKFYPENLLDVEVIFFDESNIVKDEQLEELIKKKEKAKSAKKKIAANVELGDELHYKDEWERYIKKHGLEEVIKQADLSNTFEIESKESLDTLTKHLLKFFWKGKRNEFFLKMPAFLLTRGVGAETIIKIFDRILYLTREVLDLDEDDIGNRVNAVISTIKNYYKTKASEGHTESTKKLKFGWKSYFFKIDKENPPSGPLEETLKALELQDSIVKHMMDYFDGIDDETFTELFGQSKEEILGVSVENLKKLYRDDPERAKEIVKEFIIGILRAMNLEIRLLRKYARKVLRTSKGEVRVNRENKKEKKRGRPSKEEIALEQLRELSKDEILVNVVNTNVEEIENVHRFVLEAILALPNIGDYETIKEVIKKIEEALLRYYRELEKEAILEIIKLKEVKVQEGTKLRLLIKLIGNFDVELSYKVGSKGITAVPIMSEEKPTGLFEVKKIEDIVDMYSQLNTAFYEAIGKPLYLGKDKIREIVAEMLSIDELDVLLKYNEMFKAVCSSYYFYIYNALRKFTEELAKKAITKEENELKEIKATFINFIDIVEKYKGDKIRATDAITILERDGKRIMIIPTTLLKSFVESTKTLKKLKAFWRDKKFLLKDVAVTENTAVSRKKITVYHLDYERVREFYFKETGVDLEEQLQEYVEESWDEGYIRTIKDLILSELYQKGSLSLDELRMRIGYEELLEKAVRQLVAEGFVEVRDNKLYLKEVTV